MSRPAPGSVRSSPRIDAGRRHAATRDPADDPADRPVLGATGARFGGAPRRRRAARRAAEEREGAPPAPPPAAPPTGAADPPADTAPLDVVGHLEGDSAPDRVASQDAGGVASVRPYVLTGGRTRASRDLALETLVSATAGVRSPLPLEHVALVALCAVPVSVAEVAARLQMPLGVARVLIGDLVASGALTVHGSSPAAGPDRALLARVLDGLRRL